MECRMLSHRQRGGSGGENGGNGNHTRDLAGQVKRVKLSARLKSFHDQTELAVAEVTAPHHDMPP
jgi:hypothetical protein